MDSKKQLGFSSGMRPDRLGICNGMGSSRPVGASNVPGPGRPVSNGIRPGWPAGANNSIGRSHLVGSSNGTGSGRPAGSSSDTGYGRPVGPKAMPPSKMPIAKMVKKISAPTSRNLPSSALKAPPSKVHSSDSRHNLEQKRGSQERSKDKMMPQRPPVSSKPQRPPVSSKPQRPPVSSKPQRPPVSSKPHANKPVKQVTSHSQMKSNVQRPKKRQLSEDEKALLMIRNMFRTDRYPVCDDDDVSDMEAKWDEIREEERRSAKIARQEDEEQLRLIEEEKRQKRMRQMAKKRKLSQH